MVDTRMCIGNSTVILPIMGVSKLIATVVVPN